MIINAALKGKETTVGYLASNQVVGGSSPSGRAIISMSYGALKNSTVQYLAHCPNFFETSEVVISGWGLL